MSIDTAPANGQVDEKDPGQPPSGQPASRPPADQDMSVRELLHKVNAFFYNKKTGLVLILVMAFLAFMGAIISQAPEAVRDNPSVYNEWLESVRPRYGGWTDVLDVLGFFTVFSSVWFTGTALLLCVSIVCCTVHRMPQLWQRATNPHLHVGERFFERATIRQDVVVNAEPGEERENIAARLKSSGYRVIADPKDPEGSFYADKNRWAPFGTVIAHAAFVIIIVGMVVTSVFGFRNLSFAVPVGGTEEVGHDTGLSVRVNSFADSYYEDGRPSDYVSDLSLFKDGVEVARQEVRVNTPLRYEGVAFYQSYFGAAATITIAGPTGEQLYSGSVPLQYSTEDEANVFGRLELPDQQLTVFVIGPASGRTDTPIAPGQMQVDVYRTDSEELLDNVMLDQGTPGEVNDLTVTFERERQFTGLQVSRDPGAWVIWLGSGLLILGTVITMGLKHRRLWVRITPATDETGAPVSRLRVASADRKDAIYARQIETIVQSHVNERAASASPTAPTGAAGSFTK